MMPKASVKTIWVSTLKFIVRSLCIVFNYYIKLSVTHCHWREKYVAARLYVAHKNDVFYTQKYENKKNFIKNIVEIDSDEVVTSWPSLIAEK